MTIFVTNARELFNNTDDYIVKKAKECAMVSGALKVASFALLCFNYISPVYIGLSSLALLGISLAVDYKLLMNINDLIINMFKGSESPYDSGYFAGRIAGNCFSIGGLEYWKGFFAGIKKELFQ
ncbi:MAG: hypothetical protein WCT85_06090 [Parachlamydiales bacterium]|jgi:hypothetical protein